MTELIVTPVVSWLEERQRVLCDGAAALTTYQGVIADEIVLPQSAMEAADPSAAVRASVAFAEAMETAAMLIPGEYAPEAFYSRCVFGYVDQVRAGGHAAYMAAAHGDALKVRCAMAGLRSMNADPYLALLVELRGLVEGDPKRAKKLKEGQGGADQVLKELDKRFAMLEAVEPLPPRHKIWLKSLPKLSIVADAEVTANITRIAGANPMHARRRGEVARAEEARARDDPAYTIVIALCDQAGLRLLGLGDGWLTSLRDYWAEGPDRHAFAMSATTDKGARTALLYEEPGLFRKRIAVLLAPGQAEPLGELALSEADYRTIVPVV